MADRLLLVGGNDRSLWANRGDLVGELLDGGWEVHAALPPEEAVRYEPLHPIPIHRLPMRRTGMNPWGDLRSVGALRRLVRELRPTRVLAYNPKPVIHAGLALRSWPDLPLVALVTGRGALERRPGPRGALGYHALSVLYRAALRRADVVLFQNHDDRSLFTARFPLRPGAVVEVIPGSGVNLERFPKKPLAEGPPRFLLVAKLLVDKGVREFVQAARDTVISTHTMEDAGRLARLRDRGPLLVRTNPAGAGAEEDARALAALGVDRVMLPMFRTRAEVDAVVEALGDTGPLPPRLTLLAETVHSVRDLEAIVDGQPSWVAHVHIGLNDLSLERGTPFLFEPLATGEIAELARRVWFLGRRFGFGGVGMPGHGPVPPERILGEHVRLDSSCVILSRSFHRQAAAEGPEGLARGLERVRRWESRWRASTAEELWENHQILARAILQVIDTSTPSAEAS